MFKLHLFEGMTNFWGTLAQLYIEPSVYCNP